MHHCAFRYTWFNSANKQEACLEFWEDCADDGSKSVSEFGMLFVQHVFVFSLRFAFVDGCTLNLGVFSS